VEDAGPDTQAPDDAGSLTWSGDATTYFVTPIDLGGACSGNSCSCFPEAFSPDPEGQIACAIFFALAAGDTCAAHGLTDAPSDVALSVTAAEGEPLSGALCVLPQLPSSDWVDGSCAASTAAGWCYATGAAAGSCPQIVLASPTGLPPAGATPLIGCGDPTSDDGDDAGGPDGFDAADTADATDAADAVDGAEGSAAADADDGSDDAASLPLTTVASVGTVCTPSPELSAAFGGFSYRQVTLDEGNPACPGAVCLVNHFQGLTTCPYGQDSNANPANGASTSCTVPGAGTPVRPGAVVGGETVEPWCSDRRPASAVTCSCRCENVDGRTDDGASYCACPSGYTCAQVVPEIQSGDPRAGGYCIKVGTTYVPGEACHATCDLPSTPCP
jgi:hypothetical protein